MDTVNVITDAELINEYGRQAMEGPAPEIKTQAPSRSDVQLLAGVFDKNELLKDAEVRELNGADEEAIARAGGLGKTISTILQRGVSTVGEHPVSDAILDSMLAGDRDYLLLAIRRVTFGNIIESDITCPECGEKTHINIDLEADVPVREFNGQWSWDVPTKLGVVTVRHYNGITHRKIMENLDKTVPEINSIILAGCIQSVDGAPVIALDVAKKLGIVDRETILKSISETAPGPRLLEVNKTCEACGTTINLPLSLAALFRL